MNREKRRKLQRLRGTLGVVSFQLFTAGYIAALALVGAHIIGEPKEEQIEAAASVQTTTAVTYAANTIKTTLESMDVPTGDTAFKSYMSYKAITNKKSSQYKLQRRCWTDGNGLRRYKTYYVVALGSYYADNIGDTFRITTEDGHSFECVVGDFKADRDTDKLNQYTPMQGRKCVVEFVVDMQILDRTAKKMGDISYIEGFSGDIDTIERIDE